MHNNVESNLYILCCTCKCAATCIYKGVLLLEAIEFIGLFLQGLRGFLAIQNGTTIGVLVFALIFLYVSYLAIMLFMNFNSNLADGTLKAKTSSFATIRRILIWVFLIGGLILVAIMFIFLAVIAGAVSTFPGQTEEQKKNAQTAASAIFMAGLIFSVILLVIVLIQTWIQFGLLKSVEEASLALSGEDSHAKMGNNQVL